ncbi:serine/threonine-protein kinase VPS15-like isoform X1 [Cynara cardunculus var. scolymus]|uniref:serine/threonine-protein kinase VPS15-like isoform X1 n=2 Tax=Cynara cardunculus var. scolymus TaxID=59895 RepID=UPI000D62322C|nr:serine/threonine-protein kinase VPS15-like isoform X1 [Cynara cardunculus var. scolymus]
MGNKIARTTQASASEYYLHDLPSSYNLVLKEVLGRGRFLKSIQCKHDEGLILVKVYFKRGDSVDLRDHERRLSQIREIFGRIENPHVWPFQFWLETDKAAYLLRQYFFNNLHDRLSTRPFLSLVEKKWLAFQLLYAVQQSHANGVCHGDIKCENVLVTSWNWLYLADFASFKPTYIPHDDPSDFSFFFDTGGRRRCYLAPERFYEHGGEIQIAHDAPLRPSMDIFAVGCVIAELFLEGQPLFELSQLLAYRRGQFDPTQHLEKIPDSGIRKMILHMIQLDPDLRCSAESYLQSYAGVVFPCYFSPFLHNLYSNLNRNNSDSRVALCQLSFPEILKQMLGNRAGEETVHGLHFGTNVTNRRTSHAVDRQNLVSMKGHSQTEKEKKRLSFDHFELRGDIGTLLIDGKENTRYANVKPKMEDAISSTNSQKQSAVQSPGKLLQTISNVFKRNHHPFLKEITMSDLNSLLSDYDNQSDTFGMPFLPLPQDSMSCEGMVLIASLLCSCIRNVKMPQLRRSAVLLLRSCSLYIDDEDRLQRVLPYVIAMLSDSAAIVRSAALETLCDILPLVRDFPPSDAKIFPEYILPMLSMLPDDPEESVRICYAGNISKLALTAYGFLIHSISLTEAGVLNDLSSTQKSGASSHEIPGRLQSQKNDAQLAQLRKSIAEVIQELVMGPKQTPNIRRALLQDVGNLCWFFGQRQSNDFLLPILPAFLNDRDELLRSVFFGQIIYVCFFVGHQSVEEYLLPYLEQALGDSTEAVIVNALDCLAILCRSGFLRKRILLEMIEHSFPLLCYPSQWVRRSVVTFITASSESLGAVDSHVFLVPLIRPFLRRMPASLASERALFSCLKPPVRRQTFYQILEKSKSSDMLERQRKIWYNSSAQSKQPENVDMYQKGVGELDPMKMWSDRQHDLLGHPPVSSIQPFGLIENDTEAKLRSASSFARNASGTVDIHDPLFSDKMKFSGFMSPQLSVVNSLIGDKSSEGIPLYYFKYDKRATGNASTASNSSLPIDPLGSASLSMPWMDPVNKSFTLSSSVPSPGLVSSSISIGNSSPQLHRVVHELEDRESDKTAYLSNKFNDMGVSNSSKGSSIGGADSSPPTEVAGLPSFSRTPTTPDSGWRPRGVLVAHLQEHRSAVNDIAISTDQSFFVTASDDSTVKVWDSRKLEKDITFRSRLTYSLEGSRALCTTMLHGSAHVVAGASDGTIHTFSVDYVSRGLGNVVEKYSGIADVKKSNIGEGAILTLLNYSKDGDDGKMILYSTQNCGIHLSDMRENSNSWNTKVIPEEGYISALVASPCGNWFVSGSSRGVLTLWDLRFGIPVYSWQYSGACPIEKMCLFVPPQSTSLSITVRPLVYAAAGCNEVSLWNAENGSCHQVLRLANSDSDAEISELPRALARPPSKTNSKGDARRSANFKYRVDELNEPPPRSPGIRSLLPLPGGDLLTGGSDLKIRRWDHYSPEKSYCICGPSMKGVGNDDLYETKSSFGVQIVQETRRRPLATRLTGKAVLAAAATDSGGCHRDSILSLASVKLNQRLLISSSRDGTLKVWK